MYEDERVGTGMARTTSRVDGDRLDLASKDESPIIVGTPEWFAWLENATTFVFTDPSGRFTARKEGRALGSVNTNVTPSMPRPYPHETAGPAEVDAEAKSQPRQTN